MFKLTENILFENKEEIEYWTAMTYRFSKYGCKYWIISSQMKWLNAKEFDGIIHRMPWTENASSSEVLWISSLEW